LGKVRQLALVNKGAVSPEQLRTLIAEAEEALSK